MLNINVKATNISLTPAISQYIDEKIASIEKFIDMEDPGSVKVNIEVGKTTRHHQSGDIFNAELNLTLSGKHFRAVSEQGTLYAALDDVKDEMVREVTSYRGKQRTLFRRGAARVKNIIRGIPWKNPWRKK